ncbi:MAG: DUF2191 domain-containing protein [Candidatus Wallbacteria bacterium]|nr:DUF2191 domain-containing protein [Candidatus Wallbacteria bacterium]
MKTTIDIAEPILARAKRLAAKRHTTLKAVIESALREALEQEGRPGKPFKVRTHVVKGRGLQPGLSWDDWSTLRELAYEGRGG